MAYHFFKLLESLSHLSLLFFFECNPVVIKIPFQLIENPFLFVYDIMKPVDVD